MFLRLLLLFILMPIVELGLLIEVGRHLGTWVTVALVVGTGAIGASLARSQGSRAFYRLREAIGSGAFPGDELFDGVLILAGGLLLLTPGLITDLIGFAALIPGTRHLIKSYLKRLVRRRINFGEVNAHYRVD
ncbi:MAG: FxsA family protein [Gemmatimonadetes bacterium]|jgi:UPF0716 protein FxsA|nr:FxsA family protein [Gemmatimonadota bacterium]